MATALRGIEGLVQVGHGAASPALLMPLPRVAILLYDRMADMNRALVRIGAFYEDPVLRGRAVTYEQARASRRDVGGYNFRMSALTHLLSLRRLPPLSPAEEETFAILRGAAAKGARYVVAVARERHGEIYLRHELAHAAWFLSPRYRRGVSDRTRGLPDRGSLIAALRATRLYDESVLEDELHAYLATGGLDHYQFLRRAVSPEHTETWRSASDELAVILRRTQGGHGKAVEELIHATWGGPGPTLP